MKKLGREPPNAQPGPCDPGVTRARKKKERASWVSEEGEKVKDVGQGPTKKDHGD